MPIEKVVYYSEEAPAEPFEKREECLVYDAIVRARRNPDSTFFGPNDVIDRDMAIDIARELYGNEGKG